MASYLSLALLTHALELVGAHAPLNDGNVPLEVQQRLSVLINLVNNCELNYQQTFQQFIFLGVSPTWEGALSLVSYNT